MSPWKIKTLSAFYQVAPKRLVFRIHKKMHDEGMRCWGDGPVALLHVPKTAGTSVGFALGLKDPGHVTLQELKGLQGSDASLSLMPVMVVFRDPLDRLVSTLKYAYETYRKKGFSSIQSLYKEVEPGVLEPRYSPRYYQSHFFTRSFSDFLEGGRGCNVWIVNFNYISVGFERFCEKAGLDVTVLPELNASKVDVKVRFPSGFKEEFLRVYEEDFKIKNKIGSDAIFHFEDLFSCVKGGA